MLFTPQRYEYLSVISYLLQYCFGDVPTQKICFSVTMACVKNDFFIKGECQEKGTRNSNVFL